MNGGGCGAGWRRDKRKRLRRLEMQQPTEPRGEGTARGGGECVGGQQEAAAQGGGASTGRRRQQTKGRGAAEQEPDVPTE